MYVAAFLLQHFRQMTEHRAAVELLIAFTQTCALAFKGELLFENKHVSFMLSAPLPGLPSKKCNFEIVGSWMKASSVCERTKSHDIRSSRGRM